MNQKRLQTILLAAVAVLLLSVVALGCVIGVRLAHAGNGDAGQSPVSTEGDPTKLAESAKNTPETQPSEETSPVEIRATLKIAVAAESDKDRQEALEAALEAFLDGFAAAHPGVRAEVVYSIDIPAMANGAYDLILCSADQMPGYVYGQSADLTQTVSDSGCDILGSALALGQFGGKQLFVPFCYDRAIVYANKTLFEQLNVAMPTGAYTNDQFEDLLVRLTQKAEDGSRYVGAYMPYYMPYVWMMYTRALGEGPIVDGELSLSAGANYEALSRMFTILDYGYARSWHFSAYGSDTASCAMAIAYACDPTMDGRMVVSDAELQSNPAKNAEALLAAGQLVMLPLPSFNGSYYGTANSRGTYGFAVMPDSAYPEEAAALVQYALSAEGQELLHAAYGGIPVNKAVWEQDFWRVGYLACEGSDNVLVGIEEDGMDNLYALLSTKTSNYYENAVRLDTLEWLYFYQEIGYTNKTVGDYAKPHLQNFETYANKLTRTRASN